MRTFVLQRNNSPNLACGGESAFLPSQYIRTAFQINVIQMLKQNHST